MLDVSGPNDGHLNQELDQDQDLELDNNFSSVCLDHDEVHWMTELLFVMQVI